MPGQIRSILTRGARGESFAPRRFGARLRGPAVLGLVVTAALAASAQAAWRHLAALERTGAAVTASAVDLETGRVIEQLHAGEPLRPASLTKLATAAAVLDAWAPATSFQTRLVSTARVVRHTLEGNLIVEGAGDPSLDDESLWNLAAQLRGTGISVIRGRLIIDPAPFGPVACETVDRCAAARLSDTAYNAPLGAFGVDFGTWCVEVRPTSRGAPAAVRGCGVARLPIPVHGVIRTVAARARQTFWVERVTDHGRDALRVGGNVPFGVPQQVYRAMSDPVRGGGLLLAQILREIGIRLDGPIEVRSDPPGRGARVLAVVDGLPLSEQIARMLRYSNNYMADVLSLDLAASETRHRPLTLARAGTLLANFLQRIGRLGPAAGRPVLLSGSGLTPQNRLSASDLVRLLEHEYHDARHFPAFYGSLVVPRDAPFAFLRSGSAAWLDRVALKTGTMDNPVSVCGIAGYLRKRDGGWMAFAAIVNGTRARRHIPLEQALAAEESDVDALLARY